MIVFDVLNFRFSAVYYEEHSHETANWLFMLQLDSIEKLDTLVDACRKLGVETSPRMVGGLGIIPLFSWYHEVISQGPLIPSDQYSQFFLFSFHRIQMA